MNASLWPDPMTGVPQGWIFRDTATNGTTIMKNGMTIFFLLLFVWNNDSSFALNAKELECRFRQLALSYAKKLHPWRIEDTDRLFLETIPDALQLTKYCNRTTDTKHQTKASKEEQSSSSLRSSFVSAQGRRSMQQQQRTPTDHWCPINERCIYVDPDVPNSPNATMVSTIPKALQLFRSRRNKSHPYTTIVLMEGTHYLIKTICLDAADSGLNLINYPNHEVWISGGIPIPLEHLQRQSSTLYTADLSEQLAISTNTFPSLFGEDKRYISARFPNMDPEIDQWGYNTPTKLNVSIDSSAVSEWHKPPPNGTIPSFVYLPNLKNDSYGWYDNYAAGSGGVCEALWGSGYSYWCSNASKGGWAEVDVECATTGRLQIPVGFTIDLPNTHHWENGSIVHAWHSQSWAMHMFEIEAQETNHSYRFAPGGGRQGGRNWCRCDQCTYAGRWCGQHHDNPSDDRLISGTWLVENSLSELDSPGEYFFDRETKVLTLYPNSTDELSSLRLAVLPELIRIEDNTTNVSITGIGFRDTSPTYMDKWGVPSGGDWALHRGGAIFIENSENVTISGCTFRRLDGNAIFLSRRTRHVSIHRSDFEWLGENAVAMWGDTELFDATKREFPMYTKIVGNVMRELGIFQKQSSAVAHNKAATTLISHNIMFNVPRAAINFNDMVGGGDVVKRNLLFNTCRESGDHGPIK